MGKEAQPPIPETSIVAEVIRLAEAAEAERYARRLPEHPIYRFDDLDDIYQPMPARDALIAFLRSQPDETVAGMYAIYRTGDHAYADTAEAMDRYRYSYENAILPMHAAHEAGDLAAKAPLAQGLTRGLEQLGLRIESGPADAPSPAVQRTTGSPA